MRALIFWVLCFLYSTFVLGTFPMPPVPGRPFPEDGTGASRLEFYDGVSRRLAEWGTQSSLLIAGGVLVLLFALWMAFRGAGRADRPGRRPGGVPILSFFFFLLTSLVAADYARETQVEDFAAYAQARANWIGRGEKLDYPVQPTEQLRDALRSRDRDAIRAALDAVVAPEFGKVPRFAGLYAGCRDGYLNMIRESGPIPTVSLPGANAQTAWTSYPFACRLMDQIVFRLGKADVRNERECLYGPGVKILHALDRQRLRCGLASLRGEKNPEVICRGFRDEFGVTLFSFCP